jgi:hypothetical protein
MFNFLRNKPAPQPLPEQKYGGCQSGVKRNKVSPVDPRSKRAIESGGMIGGDRMSPEHHGYAPFYEKHLAPFIGKPVILAEVGILRGHGLAMWSELFPEGQILGYDIDLGHFESTEPDLRSRGAFQNSNPELHEFDQLLGHPENVARTLNGRKLDIVIDDGLHNEQSIRNTWRCFSPLLADKFVYIIEDNAKAHKFMRFDVQGRTIANEGEISAIFSA